MPYAMNSGVRIYYEVEGQGPPMVLLHGATQSHEVWREAGSVVRRPRALFDESIAVIMTVANVMAVANMMIAANTMNRGEHDEPRRT